ncbi:peptide synthetase [Pseudomonas sp. S75]|uniref:condensation domain-containing protein n=1 Tax=unclassified Pseudomonas TaxID=196821 RepID=UPI0019056AA8|nr:MULTISPECIES: condensation domain-containing protein [unclassified Pseudomonas]MBJ9975377.1 peptide synthetase [Pseudomonas sp. S30]MBK0152649.1 peptide synthetase [Pseudomonas sp. S75]
MHLLLGQIYDCETAYDLEDLFVGELIVPTDVLLPDYLQQAVAYIYAKYPVLSAHFLRTSEGWCMEWGDVDRNKVETAVHVIQAESNRAMLAQIHHWTRVVQDAGLRSQPLLRYGLFESMESGEQRLLILFHHLVCDGISSRILWRDLSRAYQAAERGTPLVAQPCDSYLRLALELERRHRQLTTPAPPPVQPPGLMDRLCREHHGQVRHDSVLSWTVVLEPDALYELHQQAKAWRVSLADLLLGHWTCALSRLQSSGTVGLMMWMSPHFVGEWDTPVAELVGSVAFPMPVTFELFRSTLHEHVLRATRDLQEALDGAQEYAARYFSGVPESERPDLPALGFNFVNSPRPRPQLLGYRLAPERLDIRRAPEQLAELSLGFEAELYEDRLKITVQAVRQLERQLALRAWVQVLFEGLRTLDLTPC